MRTPLVLRVELSLYDAGFVVSFEGVLAGALRGHAVGVVGNIGAVVVEFEDAAREFAVDEQLASRGEGLCDWRAGDLDRVLRGSLGGAAFTTILGGGALALEIDLQVRDVVERLSVSRGFVSADG